MEFAAERDDLAEISICQSLGYLALVTCDSDEAAMLRNAINARPDIIETDRLWRLKALL